MKIPKSYIMVIVMAVMLCVFAFQTGENTAPADDITEIEESYETESESDYDSSDDDYIPYYNSYDDEDIEYPNTEEYRSLREAQQQKKRERLEEEERLRKALQEKYNNKEPESYHGPGGSSGGTGGGNSNHNYFDDGYNDGYDDMYLNEEYDEDRYNNDLDYSIGVDDAMDEIDEEEGW